MKTSITLPKDLLGRIDREDGNRSALIERVLRAYFARLDRARREAVDVQIINRNAERLNREAEEVLEYQGMP